MYSSSTSADRDLSLRSRVGGSTGTGSGSMNGMSHTYDMAASPMQQGSGAASSMMTPGQQGGSGSSMSGGYMSQHQQPQQPPQQFAQGPPTPASAYYQPQQHQQHLQSTPNIIQQAGFAPSGMNSSSSGGGGSSLGGYPAPSMPSSQPSPTAAPSSYYAQPVPQTSSGIATFDGMSGSGHAHYPSSSMGGGMSDDHDHAYATSANVGGVTQRSSSPPQGSSANTGLLSGVHNPQGGMSRPSGLGGLGLGLGGLGSKEEGLPFYQKDAHVSDDRLRRRQNTDALNLYVLFMYGMIGLAGLVMLVAWMAMGSGAGYVALVLSICVFSFLFTLHLTKWIFSKDDGNPAMRVISEAIREGSEGFLRVQYTSIGIIAIIIAGLIGFVYLFRETPSKELTPSTLALVTALSYITGAFCSALAGYIGVWVSVRVNIRVAVSASKHSFKDALLLSFRGGAVSACLSASLCILGVTILYVLCYLFFVTFGGLPSKHVPMLLVGYGFGGALVALFMQLGGGIYTKAADVGADMIGKVEAGIPEDDPRNPAVIADLVGDNVGDCAGSMADVFESIAAEVIGTMILGAALAHESSLPNPEPWIFFPLIIHSFDLIISSIGIMMTMPKNDKEDPLTTMKRAYAICMVLAVIGFAATCRFLLYTPLAPSAWWNYTLCGWIGIVMSFLIIRSTQYYTDSSETPVKRIAAASQTGHGTNVIAGMAVGLESTCFPTLTIAAALLAAYTLGLNSGLGTVTAGVFGTAVATMGMLCTAVFVLSMNNFGPIADNAGGIVEMSGQPHDIRVITDRLDSVGNVTKAASKGYAVGGSALSCFVLFQAFLDEISSFSGLTFNTINLAQVEVVCGGLIGMMMIFLFAGWSMRSVGTTAQKVVWEVRRQFKAKPGIMDGSEKPDYDTCVAIVTREALKEMVWPALLALLLPISVGFGFKYFGEWTNRPQLGVEVVAGFMMIGTLAGLLMAMLMDNAGGAWDNAKKLIESQGLKGSEAHKAAVTGDTVGDPFKDTAGPALHVIITTMSTTILVLGPLFVGRITS